MKDFKGAGGRFLLVPIVFTLIFALLAGGCGDGEEEEIPAPTTTAPATASPPPQETPVSTPSPERTVVQIYFLDEEKFAVGAEPFVVAVERQVDAQAAASEALEQLFAGPTAEEEALGLRFVNSGATGFSDFAVEDGIARVQLTGGCDSGGSTFTIAQEIIPTLTQFPNIEHVKVLDPEGSTENPEGPGDSIPFCLEP